ncbi:MAG: TatD family hydrolase, partial [Candidatus Gallimonas sp.]
GGYFSFGGVLCFKNARKAVESAQACPLDRILSETDSPYLSPFRGEKNSPANLPVVVEKIASVKGISFQEAESAIKENALRLFEKLG